MKAKKLLAENREAMDRIADYLFKKENITGKQFMALFENRDPDAPETVGGAADLEKEHVPENSGEEQKAEDITDKNILE